MKKYDLTAASEVSRFIDVGDIYEAENANVAFIMNICVRNHEKYVALDRVMPKVKTFGNITVAVILYDEENINSINPDVELYQTIFKDNPIVKDIQDTVDHTDTHIGYVRFRPEVIQFFDDDISDFNGNWSGLAEDIAGDVFENGNRMVFFCTADKRENQEQRI